MIPTFIVLYDTLPNRQASFHRSKNAAMREAKRGRTSAPHPKRVIGEVFQRNPFAHRDTCEMPLWADVFKDNAFVPYHKV